MHFFLIVGETVGEILLKKVEGGKWREIRTKQRRSSILLSSAIAINPSLFYMLGHKRVSSMNEHFTM